MSCSRLVEIEDLVLEAIEPSRARELRAHVAACTACRLEQAAVVEERALFTHREAVMAGPSDAVAVALRAQLTRLAEEEGVAGARPSIRGSRTGPARRGATLTRGPSAQSAPPVRRLAHVVWGGLCRGHVSAACAAFLFALVAFSKIGGAPILPAAGSDGANSEAPSGPIASFFSQSLAAESLACSVGGSTTTFGNDEVVSSGPTTQSSSSGATMREVLACGRGGEGSGASCEPSVMCSSIRQ